MKQANILLLALISVFVITNCIHLRKKQSTLIFSKIHSRSSNNQCNNSTILNQTLSLADMLTLTEYDVISNCNCSAELNTLINAGISYVNGLSDNDITNIIQTLNQTKQLILKVKNYLVNTGQNSFIQLSTVKRNLKNSVKVLLQLTKDEKFKLINIDENILISSTQATGNLKWQLTMDTIATLDSLMLWFENLKLNEAQLIAILSWIQQDCYTPEPYINNTINNTNTTTNNTNQTYVDPDRPNNTDPAYDFTNQSYTEVSILLQGDDNLYLEYTADYKKYIFVGSTQQWNKRLQTTFQVQRGVGKFKVSVNNSAGAGGFVGRLTIDGIDFYTNLDNFKPSPENNYTTINQFDSSLDSGWKNNNLGFNGGFWIWPEWGLYGKASYDFSIPLICTSGYVQFYQKCFYDEPFKFDSFHFIPEYEFSTMVSNDSLQISSTKTQNSSAFVQRPIKNQEFFGVKKVTNDNFAIGLCLKETNFISERSTNIFDNKTAMIKNNPFAFGVTYDSSQQIWSLGNETSYSSNLVKDCSGPGCMISGFWFQYFQESNTITVYYKNFKPMSFKMPYMLIGRRLYPCVQVWDKNAVTIQNSSLHP